MMPLAIVSNNNQIVDAFKLDGAGHYSMTRAALGFLEPRYVDWINDGHFRSDVYFSPSASRHMDNCRFYDSISNINYFYFYIIEKTDLKENAAQTFGAILHLAQDFYSHSNWVELATPANPLQTSPGWSVSAPGGLIDPVKDNFWKELGPGFSTVASNVYVVNGNLHPGWQFTVDTTTKKATAEVIDGPYKGAKYPALISGEVWYEQGRCPQGAKLRHGFFTPEPGDLNKDVAGKPGFSEARALAIQQTFNEWCRLINLVGQLKGAAAKDELVKEWTLDGNEKEATRNCVQAIASSGPASPTVTAPEQPPGAPIPFPTLPPSEPTEAPTAPTEAPPREEEEVTIDIDTTDPAEIPSEGPSEQSSAE